MKTIDNLIEEMKTRNPFDQFRLQDIVPKGDEWQPQFRALRSYAESAGWQVVVNANGAGTGEAMQTFIYTSMLRPDSSTLGVTDLERKVIWLRRTNPDTQTYTLAHELGHTLQPKPFDAAAGMREMFAETVAYLTLSELMPEWENEVSPLYLANWRVPEKILRKWGPKMVAAAQTIVASVNLQSTPLATAA